MAATPYAAAIAALPGFDASTRSALAALTDRHPAAGMSGPDRSGDARTLVAQTVNELRRGGMSHEQIREKFTGVLKGAQATGDVACVTAAQTVLTVHAGMLADTARIGSNQGGGLPKVEKGAPVPALGAAPVDEEHQGHKEAAPVNAERGGFRPAAWWENPENAVSQVPPADGAAALELPPHEEGYEPEKGAKPYQIRRVRAALEAAGVQLRPTGQEFAVLVGGRDDQNAHVTLLHFDGKGAKPRKGKARDRWERRRAELLIVLVDAGMEDVELSNAGLWARVPRPQGAATVVMLEEKDYGENFEAEYITQAVSFPQYPAITGWQMRRKWGRDYRGPMTPWMYHTGTGEVIASSAKDEHQAAAALAAHYGLMVPVRVWHG